jgi:hypothetical protein
MHYQKAHPMQQFNEMYLSMHELRKIIFLVYSVIAVDGIGAKLQSVTMTAVVIMQRECIADCFVLVLAYCQLHVSSMVFVISVASASACLLPIASCLFLLESAPNFRNLIHVHFKRNQWLHSSISSTKKSIF